MLGTPLGESHAWSPHRWGWGQSQCGRFRTDRRGQRNSLPPLSENPWSSKIQPPTVTDGQSRLCMVAGVCVGGGATSPLKKKRKRKPKKTLSPWRKGRKEPGLKNNRVGDGNLRRYRRCRELQGGLGALGGPARLGDLSDKKNSTHRLVKHIGQGKTGRSVLRPPTASKDTSLGRQDFEIQYNKRAAHFQGSAGCFCSAAVWMSLNRGVRAASRPPMSKRGSWRSRGLMPF